jgi:hypothetical membrane protein
MLRPTYAFAFTLVVGLAGSLRGAEQSPTAVRVNAARSRDRLTLAALYAAVLIPFIYYGVQVVGAAFNPGYSFVRQVASELGSDRAARPGIFNVGIMVQGGLTLIAAAGFLRAMLRVGVNPLVASLAFTALAINGVQMLWAGYFPMPDPRHGGHAVFIIAVTLLPVLLTAALWRQSGAIARAYFVATLVLLLAMVPVMNGRAGIDTSHVRGLRQRVYGLTVFPPIAVAACVLAGRLRRMND